MNRDDQTKSMLLREAESAVNVGKGICIIIIGLMLFGLFIAAISLIGGRGY